MTCAHKRILTIGLLVILVAGVGTAEQLTKIAVVDMTRIIENFPSDSAGYRRFRQRQTEYEQEAARLTEEYDRLQLELLELKESGTEAEILRKENEIEAFLQNMRTLLEIMRNRIERAVEELKQGSGIIEDIIRAIEYIAENEGYTAVFYRSDPNLVYYSLEIDITDKVIQRLRIMARYQ